MYVTEVTWLAVIVSLVFWLLVGWFCFLPLAPLWSRLKDVVHKCPKCSKELGRSSRTGLQGVIPRKFCVAPNIHRCCILAVVLVASVLLTCALGFYGPSLSFIANVAGVQASPSSTHTVSRPSVDVDMSWGEFFLELPGAAFVANLRLRNSNLRASGYAGSTFKWRGKLAGVRDGLAEHASFYRNALLVHMDPPKPSVVSNFPSVVLVFGDEMVGQVQDLVIGASIEFESTLLKVGELGDPVVMRLRHVARTSFARSQSASSAKLSEQSLRPMSLSEQNFLDERIINLVANQDTSVRNIFCGGGLISVAVGNEFHLRLLLVFMLSLATLLLWGACMYIQDFFLNVDSVLSPPGD